MNLMQELLDAVTSTALVQNLGWLLVHSLWQCTLIAFVTLCIAKAMRRQSSSARYWLYSLALLLVVIAPVATMLAFPQSNDMSLASEQLIQPALAELSGDSQPIEVDQSNSIPLVASLKEQRLAASESVTVKLAAEPAPDPIKVSYSEWIDTMLRPWLSTIVAVWFCGVLLFSIRPIWGWLMVRHLLRVGTSPVATHVQEALQKVCAKMQVRRRVEVLTSTLVGSPIVVGCFRSVILVPTSLISSLPITQLEAILAHELAHVRRYDFLVNLLQTLIETVFFYHPAIWWLSHRLRVERENCCDDCVVLALDNKAEYGRALLAVEEFRRHADTMLALSVKGGSLLARIRRLVTESSADDRRGSAVWAALAIVFVGATATVWLLRNAQADVERNFGATNSIAQITENLSIELLAVQLHNGDQKMPWKPDGQTFETVPELPEWKDTSNQFAEGSRHLLFQWKGLPKDVGLTYQIPGQRMYLHPDESGFARLIAEPTKEGDVVTVKVGVTDTEWGPWQTVGTDGKVTVAAEIPPACLDVYDKVRPDHIEERNNACLFCWSGLKVDRGQFELVAVTKDGQRTQYYGRSAWNGPNGPESAEVFNIPLSEIASFEYRLRPYRHWVTFENVSLTPGKKTELKVSIESIPIPSEFGLESHGLQARLIALRPDVSNESPNLDAHQSEFEHSGHLTFGVELKNVGQQIVTLAGIRFGNNFSEEVRGTPRAEFFAPHWFEFEFMDSTGKPLRRTHREFHQSWQVADNASTHELASQQSLIEVLRPGKFDSPMNFDLPPGKYKVRVRYHGPNQEFRDEVRKHWPNKPILNAWPHEVVSNTIDFQIAEGRKPTGDGIESTTPDGPIRAATNLVWGEPVDGLQAAMEYRTTDDVLGDPTVAPGIPIGTPFNVIFHLKNVSDKAITFISETVRRGDKVHVTNERGKEVNVDEVWRTGESIDVAWKLEPGEIAQLSSLALALRSLDRPGKYNVRYKIRFNSRVQKDDAGNVIFPRPGDYDKEVDTGVTPLFLTAAQKNPSENPQTPDLPEAPPGTATATEAASVSPNGEIRGILTDGEGKPVAGEVVACGAIYREDGNDGGTRATTDAAGHYRLVVPSPGIYTVFLKSHDADLKMTAAADDGLEVEAGKVTESMLRLVAGQRVGGKAVDENGTPFVGLTVMSYSAARPQSLGGVQSTMTQDDGSFEFYLAAGPARVYATEKVSQTEENPFGFGRTGSIDLTIPQTGAIDPVTLTLVRRKSRFGSDEWLTSSTPGTKILSSDLKDDITGTVVDEAGSVLANVMIIKINDKPVTSDAEGRFRVPCQNGTQFVMNAFLSGYQVWFGTPTAGDELKIVMVKKTNADVAIEADGTRVPEAQPGNPQSDLNDWKNAWREFYAAKDANDSVYIRNATVDLTGTKATEEDVVAFINDSAADKRPQLIDKLLVSSAYEKFQSQLTSENDAFQTKQETLPSRILRGPQSQARANVYRPKTGNPVDGLTLAVSLRSATNRFKVGERIPLDVLLLNSSKETMTHEFSFDFMANPPRVLDETGNEIPIEKVFASGAIPLYRETLRPGDYFIYPHIGLGLGENPHPQKSWNPHTPVLKPGKYKLTQQWKGLTSGEIEFEVVSRDGENSQVEPTITPAPTKTLADSENVMSVGFDDDGKLWSVATRHRVTVRKWDMESGEKLNDVELETDKHANMFLSGGLQLSPDRSHVIAVDDGKVAVWDSTTGKRVATLSPEDSVGAFGRPSCSRDLSRIACGMMQRGGWIDPDAQASIWDGKTGQVIRSVTHKNSVQIHCTSLSPDGRWLATGSQEAGLCLWDVDSGELKHHFPNENAGRQYTDPKVEVKLASQVVSVCFSPNGTRLAMSDLLGVKVFDVESGELLHDFVRPFRYGRSGLVFSADSNLLARVGTDNVTSLWNLQTGQFIAELPSESHCGSFSKDGHWFAVGFTDDMNGIRAWRIANEIVPTSNRGAVSPTWLRFCPGTQIVEHTDNKFVSGVVVDEEGRPIAGCRVEHPGLVNPKTTDEFGKFQHEQSVPHRTVLRAYHPDYRPWHGAPEPGDVVRIVLYKKPKIDAVNGSREMTVRVIDSRTAEPIPNVKVTANRYEGPQNGTVAATAVTNEDGNVTMRGLDFIQHQLLLSSDQPISYIGNLAHPDADDFDVVMLVDRACELVLRAVDSETGKGIAGVRFDRERALAELWATPVVNDSLGSTQAQDTLTDADGYARFLVGPATWSYMILKYPEGYDSIVPESARPAHFSEEITKGQEAEIPTPVGGKVEHTFRLIKTTYAATEAPINQDDAAGELDKLRAIGWQLTLTQSAVLQSDDRETIFEADDCELTIPGDSEPELRKVKAKRVRLIVPRGNATAAKLEMHGDVQISTPRAMLRADEAHIEVGQKRFDVQGSALLMNGEVEIRAQRLTLTEDKLVADGEVTMVQALPAGPVTQLKAANIVVDLQRHLMEWKGLNPDDNGTGPFPKLELLREP